MLLQKHTCQPLLTKRSAAVSAGVRQCNSTS